MNRPYIYKFAVPALVDADHATALCRFAKNNVPTILQIDTNLPKRLIRIISAEALQLEALKKRLETAGFALYDITAPTNTGVGGKDAASPGAQNTCQAYIDGMTCRSCELTVERKWKKVPGVTNVRVNAATGLAELTTDGSHISMESLQKALSNSPYRVHPSHQNMAKSRHVATGQKERPTVWRLCGVFFLVLAIGWAITRLGLFKTNFTVGNGIGFSAVFIIGLLAASSSCIAVVGGLLLSTTARFNERYTALTPVARMRPVLLFVAGRIAGYTLLGGLLGTVGGILTPSPLATAAITILAALYMLVMGLDMLQLAPVWLKNLLPHIPKKLSHRIMDAEGKEHPLAPLALGAATFFLPCGFTQSLQLYALTTGSFIVSASLLLAFALGTAPALLALGLASSSFKGKLGQFFFQFSGALVVVLGMWNIQNGLTITGYPLPWPKFISATSASGTKPRVADPNVTWEGNTQIIKMGFSSSGQYAPNHFTVVAGKPVRWEVDGTDATGCTSVLTSRQLGIQKILSPGINRLEFTPQQPGEIKFSCSMGMVRGSFTVVPPS